MVFLDEFGHIGPFVSRHDPSHNTSPVFGVAGFFLHESRVRDFGSWFFNFKNDLFETDIAASSRPKPTWEKKGTEIFTSGRAHKTKRIGFSLINQIKAMNGRVFFHGIEKYQNPERSNPHGLYYTALRHAIESLERCFANKAQNFLIILDEHQSRVVLLESAVRKMFERGYPARHLIEPPYQVESHLYQTIQAADWIASIVGALHAFRVSPHQFPDREWAEKYFSQRLEAASTHSRLTQAKAARTPKLI